MTPVALIDVKTSSKNPSSPRPTEILSKYKSEATRFIAADRSGDRRLTAGRMAKLWQTALGRARKSGLMPDRSDEFDHVDLSLAALVDEGDAKARDRAIGQMTASFERLTKVLETHGTPASPAARWLPAQPPLAAPEREKRLKKVGEQTRGTARTLAEAVRKVVAARRDHGVPLHETVSHQMQTQYAQAVTTYEIAVVPQAPHLPPTSRRTAPWGVFQVKSPVPPAEAEAVFALSPPLPARGELLASRTIKTQLLPLPPVGGGAGSTTGRPSNATP